MKSVDPKLDGIFISMLEHHDIKEIISSDANYVKMFSPLQLLEMVGKVLDQIREKDLSKILTRFQEEVTAMKNQSQAVDHGLLESWSDQMMTLLLCKCSQQKRVLLLNFCLDIFLVCRPVFVMSEAFSALTQAISLDAFSHDVTLTDLCTRWSRYLPKVHRFSLEAHRRLMDYFKDRVKDTKPEIAFEVFIEEADTLTKDMSEILLGRAVLVFQDKTVHSDSPIKGLKRAKRLSALTPGGPQIYDPDFRRTV